ncbi:MAG: carboxypeptidase-like regulatory domain-containing protein [Gallionella sp.]
MNSIRLFLAIFIGMFLAACGGGGGGAAPVAPTTYSISGAVSGAAASGVTVTMTGTSAATTTTDATGNYSFTGLTNGNYTITPTKATFAFSPTSSAVTVSGANVTGKNFVATAAAVTYSISGAVSGAATSGVTISLSGANTATVFTGAGGTYTLSGLVAGAYTVTPSLTGYSFAPASITIAALAANSTANNFVATLIPVAHILSGTVSPALAGVTITVTGTANTTATTAVGGTYSVPGLFDGPYTVTPSKVGYTFAPNSAAVTMAGANLPNRNFTGTANTAVQAVISGSVTGPWVEGVTITMSGGAGGTTTTNASGNYSFTVASGQSYTFTPNLAGYSYAPASATVVIPGGSSAAATATTLVASSTKVAYSISGTVSYAGAKTGAIRIQANYSGCTNCGAAGGTTIAAPGAYTIRGLQPGSYVIVAQRDAQGTGQANANNPVGSSAVATIAAANLPGITVAMADPVAPTPVTLTGVLVSPSAGSAFIQYTAPVDVNSQEIATSYKVDSATDAAFTLGLVTKTFTAQGTNQTLVVMNGLSNVPRWFRMTALVGATASAASPATGPITIGTTAGLNTVSGNVTFSGAATGPMIVGAYDQVTQAVYYTTIPTPLSPQAYTISGVPAGSYANFAVIDMNNNGRIDAGDIHNTGGNNTPTITVAGPTTGNITLSSANTLAAVYTNHWFDGVTNSYNLNPQLNDGMKRIVSAVLFSGPNVTVPMDMSNSYGSFQAYTGIGAIVPVIGDTYQFKVTYSDASTQIVTSTVTGVLNFFATSLAVNTAGFSRNIPQFTWAAPVTPPASYLYSLSVSLLNGGQTWYFPQNSNGLPSTTLAAVYNSDGSANPTSLVTGTAYTWQVRVMDANGNSASYQAPTYTP